MATIYGANVILSERSVAYGFGYVNGSLIYAFSIYEVHFLSSLYRSHPNSHPNKPWNQI